MFNIIANRRANLVRENAMIVQSLSRNTNRNAIRVAIRITGNSLVQTRQSVQPSDIPADHNVLNIPKHSDCS
jgi:hypothetical protein